MGISQFNSNSINFNRVGSSILSRWLLNIDYAKKGKKIR
jgi:hypothetical protein